jgi:hypothetical protein
MVSFVVIKVLREDPEAARSWHSSIPLRSIATDIVDKAGIQMKTRSWSELFDGRRRKLTAVSKLEYGVCGWPLSLTVVITVFGW